MVWISKYRQHVCHRKKEGREGYCGQRPWQEAQSLHYCSGVAWLGHTGACAPATRGHAPPTAARLQITDAESALVNWYSLSSPGLKRFPVTSL